MKSILPRSKLKTFALFKGTSQLRTIRARNIDHAVDIFFVDVQVDVDLSTATPHRLTVRPLRQRKSIEPFTIEELPPHADRELP